MKDNKKVQKNPEQNSKTSENNKSKQEVGTAKSPQKADVKNNPNQTTHKDTGSSINQNDKIKLSERPNSSEEMRKMSRSIEKNEKSLKKKSKLEVWQELIDSQVKKKELMIKPKKKKMKIAKANNIKVVIRVRKLLRNEVGKENIVYLDQTDDKKIKVGNNGNLYEASFDMAFGYYSSQSDVFEFLLEAVENVLKGTNSTIFTYGQTGTGKTFTMFGSDWTNIEKFDSVSISKIKKDNQSLEEEVFNYNEININPFSEDNGIIPRALNHIFAEIEIKNLKKKSFSIFVTYMQIYNEKIYDLLTDKFNDDKSFSIREDKYLGIYIDGLSEHPVQNIYECINLLRKGERSRKKRQTDKNDVSSRSHTVFQVLIIEENTDKIKKTKLNLCDLAGSEKLDKDHSIEKTHFSELSNINSSLSTLGNVINALATKKSYIPYRDSKLTRILQDSLGGDTATYLIATLSPSILSYEETLSTLKFAERAKNIKKTKADENFDYDEKTIRNLKEELQSLKTVLNMKKLGKENDIKEELEALRKENSELKNHVLSGYDRNKLVEENEKLMKDLIKIKVESSDPEMMNDNIKKTTLPNLYENGFSNSKYKEIYEMSKKNKYSYNEQVDYLTPNNLNDSSQFYKNEIDVYTNSKYKKYLDNSGKINYSSLKFSVENKLEDENNFLFKEGNVNQK